MLHKFKSLKNQIYSKAKRIDLNRWIKFGQIKERIASIDWQELSERFDPERITNDPRFQRLIQNLHLPDYVHGPTDETEFLPAALEIVETPPLPAARIIGRIIIAFFALGLFWSLIGSVDIIAAAQGKIVSTGRTKVIQPFETGVVQSIHVQDGQKVNTGDVLVEIDSTINEAERNRLQNEYIDAELNVARIKAAVSALDNPLNAPDAGFEPIEGASQAQIATHKNLLINQVQEIRAKLSGLDQQIAKEQGNLSSVQSTIDKLRETIPLLKKRVDAKNYLAARGYGSRLDALTIQQDLIEHQQELNVQQGKFEEASAAVISLQQQRKQGEAEWLRTNLDQLTQDEQKAASLKEQLVQAAEKTRLQTLTSPVDGTVQQLAIHTNGGVVTPAQDLMAIAPNDSRLEIEVMVSNRDIGFVHAGQEAAIKVDTFDYTKYGLMHGKVMSVSQDAIVQNSPKENSSDKAKDGDKRDSSEPKGQELVYSARIQIAQTQMEIDDRLVTLVPGMAITAEIKTGKRRIISYLLSPIQKHLHQAMRER